MGGTIIVYHGIGASPPGAGPDELLVGPDVFEKQIRYLSRHRRVVPLAALVDGGPGSGSPAIAITFDDGFRSVLTDALPVLERFGTPATVFVTTRWLIDPSAQPADPTDHFAAASAPTLELLSEADVAELGRRGFEVGSHGHTHADLGRASASIAEADLRASRDALAEILGRPPRFLAWPYGSSSNESRAAAAELGFDAAFGVEGSTTDRFAIERVLIYRSDGRVALALKTSPHFQGRLRPLIRRAQERIANRSAQA